MKWIRTAIGAVIAVIMVGIIATSVYSMTQERGVIKEVEFTVNLNDNTYTPNVYERVNLYSVIDDNGEVTNVSMVKLNNVVTNDLSLSSVGIFSFSIFSVSKDGSDIFLTDGTYEIEDGIFQDGDIITLAFEVLEAQLTGTIAIILGLVPLIVASGVLYFMLRKNNLGE